MSNDQEPAWIGTEPDATALEVADLGPAVVGEGFAEASRLPASESASNSVGRPAGGSAGSVFLAIFISPVPWASRISAVSLRASQVEAFGDEDQLAAGSDDHRTFAGGVDLLR